MKNKIFIFFIAIALILSVGSVVANENIDDGLSVDDEIDEIQEVGVNNQVQEDILASDESEEDLSYSDDVDEIIGSPAYVNNGKVTNRYADGVIYEATFYDSEGYVLKDTSVFCGLDSKEFGYTGVTDSNGVAKIAIPAKIGNHKLYLISAYNIDNPVIDDINIFKVLTGNKNIKMYYDGGNTYSVRVYGDDGKPVSAGEKVTFYLENKKYTRSTDKNGYAKFKITSKPGIYQIGALYKDYAVLNTVLVKPVLKQLTTFKNKVVKPKIKFKVKFLGKNKKNKKIKVKFNKKTYKAKTNKKGIATFKLKTPKKVGYYKVVVSYKKCKISATYAKYYA